MSGTRNIGRNEDEKDEDEGIQEEWNEDNLESKEQDQNQDQDQVKVRNKKKT